MISEWLIVDIITLQHSFSEYLNATVYWVLVVDWHDKILDISDSISLTENHIFQSGRTEGVGSMSINAW